MTDTAHVLSSHAHLVVQASSPTDASVAFEQFPDVLVAQRRLQEHRCHVGVMLVLVHWLPCHDQQRTQAQGEPPEALLLLVLRTPAPTLLTAGARAFRPLERAQLDLTTFCVQLRDPYIAVRY